MSGLQEEYAGRVIARNVDASDEAAKLEIQELGFKNHGLVIRSHGGNILWKQADHTVKIDEVRTALVDILKS